MCSLGRRLPKAYCGLIAFPDHIPSPGQSHGLARDISGILQLEEFFVFVVVVAVV